MTNLKYIIFAFVMLCLFSCKAQHENKTTTIKKIDLEKYKGLKKEGYYKINNNDTITEVRIKGSEYLESKCFSKSNITHIKKYAYSTGILKEESQMFSKLNTGITKIYDDKGVVVKEIDNDAPYPFSLDQIIELIKNKFNINIIEQKNKRSVDRYFSTNHKDYIYIVNDPINIFKVRTLVINGSSGAILSDNVSVYGDL